MPEMLITFYYSLNINLSYCQRNLSSIEIFREYLMLQLDLLLCLLKTAEILKNMFTVAQ